MSRGTQVFLYPEELDHVDPRVLAEQIRDLGFDAALVSIGYHRARRVLPRHRRISVLPRYTLYIEPDRARYGDLVPEGRAMAAVRAFREACDSVGLAFGAWVVALHNDTLAASSPGSAAQLIDGTPAGHSLCPSSPAAVEYVAALVADVAAQLSPTTIDLEAAFYPAWEPSYTLTLALEQPSEGERLLLAQCFCHACLALLPPDVVAHARNGEAVTELAAGRAEGAGRLLERAAVAAHAEGSMLRAFCSGPPEQATLQGVSPASVAAVDDLLFGCGPLAGDELLGRFEGLRACAGRSGSVSMNWSPTRAALADDAARLAGEGAGGLALYNLSLVPDAGLDAFRAAAAAYRKASSE